MKSINIIRATEQTPLGRDMLLDKVREAFVMLVVKTTWINS